MVPPPSVLLVRVQPAPTWRTNLEETALTHEPHHLLVMFAGIQGRLTDCHCENCASLLPIPLVAPAQLTALFLEDGVERVEFMLHRDLRLPLADGSEPACHAPIHELAHSLAAAGIHVSVREARAHDSGTWVRTTQFHWIEPSHVIVPGLLGQVVPDPYGICTPGVSTFIQLLGRGDPYGYADGLFDLVEDAPTAAETAAAESLCCRAFEVFEAVHGWSGFVRTSGGGLCSEAQIRREIAANLKRLTGARPLPERDQRGMMKRTCSLLRSLGQRGSPHTGAALAERLDAVHLGSVPAELAADLLHLAATSLTASGEPDN